MSQRPDKTAEKIANPVSSPQLQSGQAPDNEGVPLRKPDPATEAVDKAITPTSIKDKERQNQALRETERKVERALDKDS